MERPKLRVTFEDPLPSTPCVEDPSSFLPPPVNNSEDPSDEAARIISVQLAEKVDPEAEARVCEWLLTRCATPTSDASSKSSSSCSDDELDAAEDPSGRRPRKPRTEEELQLYKEAIAELTASSRHAIR
jgi:hypothetical protein